MRLAHALSLGGLVAATGLALSAAPAVAQSRPVIKGDWTATHKVVQLEGINDRRRGSTYRRPWLFSERCRRGRCRLIARLERFDGTYYRWELVRRGRRYSGSAVTRSICGERLARGRIAVRLSVARSVVRGNRRFASELRGAITLSYRCFGQRNYEADQLRMTRDDLPESPTAAFSFEPSSPVLLDGRSHIVFIDESEDESDGGEIRRWAWDFGDPASGAANTSTSASPDHTYTAAGSYRVQLAVTDNDGLTASTSRIVTVTSPAG